MYQRSPGYVLTAKTPRGLLAAALKAEPCQRVKPGQLRGMTTFVASICSDSSLQQFLPQIFIAGPKVFSPEAAANFNAAAPGAVYYWAESSAWNRGSLMQRYLELLAASLDHVKEEYQIILIFDTATPHLPRPVTETANRLGIWLAVVPSGLTWLVQPLDARAMACLKAYLHREYSRVASESPNGVMEDEEWAKMLARAATDFLGSRSWAAAFEETGCTGHVGSLGESLLRQLRPCRPDQVLSLPLGCPSTQEIKSLFPRNRRVLTSLYFRCPLSRLLGAD